MLGFFDSGFGGLTVLKEFLKKFPDFDYVYLGDQANNPYGNRSSEQIIQLTGKGIRFLIDQGCTLIIIACNTASTEALRHVQQIYKGTPTILGVLVPAVEEALRVTRHGQIGVLGTRGTIESGAYERELQKYASVGTRLTASLREFRIFPQPCPLLVPLIEEGWAGKPETRMILKKYLRPLKSCHVDTLILGCTHYPILEKEIRRYMGKNCQIVNTGLASAKAMKDYFDRHPDVLQKLTRKSEYKFYTTDSIERFNALGSKFLGKGINAEKAII